MPKHFMREIRLHSFLHSALAYGVVSVRISLKNPPPKLVGGFLIHSEFMIQKYGPIYKNVPHV